MVSVMSNQVQAMSLEWLGLFAPLNHLAANVLRNAIAPDSAMMNTPVRLISTTNAMTNISMTAPFLVETNCFSFECSDEVFSGFSGTTAPVWTSFFSSMSKLSSMKPRKFAVAAAKKVLKNRKNITVCSHASPVNSLN